MEQWARVYWVINFVPLYELKALNICVTYSHIDHSHLLSQSNNLYCSNLLSCCCDLYLVWPDLSCLVNTLIIISELTLWYCVLTLLLQGSKCWYTLYLPRHGWRSRGGGDLGDTSPPNIFDGLMLKPLKNYCWLCAVFSVPQTLTRNRRRCAKVYLVHLKIEHCQTLRVVLVSTFTGQNESTVFDW